MFPTDRPRRLRANPGMRRLVAETEVRPRHLVLPAFVAEGLDAPLYTCDRKLAAGGHTAEVVVI